VAKHDVHIICSMAPEVQFGVAMFPTDDAIAPAELARLAEERDFESLWLPEHTHIPASRESPWPGGPELPREYWHTHDPFVALAQAAAVTERLKLATGICLIVERDPITTAKEVASLDRLSGGRFLFGVGAGWNREEMANHGTDPRRRFSLMRERIEAMKAIWTSEEPEYHGEQVDFDAMWSWPKPLQEPHPPVHIGGGGDKVLDRVLAFGDGWMPNRVPDEETFTERLAELRRRASEAGRDPIPVTLVGALDDRSKLARLAEAGVTRLVTWIRPEPRPDAERRLDRLAAFAAAYRSG
jgi:probable F420-dependent oxidoreductase